MQTHVTVEAGHRSYCIRHTKSMAPYGKIEFPTEGRLNVLHVVTSKYLDFLFAVFGPGDAASARIADQ